MVNDTTLKYVRDRCLDIADYLIDRRQKVREIAQISKYTAVTKIV
jgi:hypothetical protein